jgi:enoyl-CoA hydratase/carnithine racemase
VVHGISETVRVLAGALLPQIGSRVSVRIDSLQAGVRRVLMDRFEKRNALDTVMVAALAEALRAPDCRAIVLGSSDSRVFSAGADLDLEDSARASVSDELYSLYQDMRRSPVMIVAAASGPAVGGGAQLLLASDVRIGSPDLTIRFLGAAHGLAVGAWGLPCLVGRGRALELCLSMRSVGAEEAFRIGLVDRMVDDPLEEALAFASKIAALDPVVVRRLKAIVGTPDHDAALALERRENSTWDGSVPPDPSDR